MQDDMFADLLAPAPEPEVPPAPAAPDITVDDLPEKLRAQPLAMHARKPEGGPQLDEWTRVTQRLYLLWLVGTLARNTYRDSSIVNARQVLRKLNGLGGEW
ncbi:hypothetical protein [Paraburkholderia kururiensis]|uniref:hypothetical protein n=1 Tax=Paraburkholderia kururiensis TaxID=984307 RepID=UPI0005AAAA18|nr:hypothetical protein [Paraburkholderia kururiensis]